MSNGYDIKALPHERQLNEKQIVALERRIMMAIEKKRRQVNRIRWAVGIAWGLLLLLLVIGGFTEITRGHGALTSTIAMAARAMLLIALFLTAAWHVRSVSLRFDSVQQALAAIYDRIAEEPAGGSQENTVPAEK